MQLTDSHCHLQDKRLAADVDGVLERARRAGVGTMVCCGTSEADWRRVAEIARHGAGVIPAFGLHPWFVTSRSTDWLDVLRERLADHTGAAVGEIGLDASLASATFDLQMQVFAAQLALAHELNRTVSIHCRSAWGALVDVLRSIGRLPERGIVLHAYSGSPDLIAQLARLGASFSFAGSVTLSRNHRAHRAVPAVPADGLLIETDAPDMPPMIKGVRDMEHPNEPAHLLHVANKVAALRGMSLASLAGLTVANANRLFGGAC
jgi:TatD DNase family protein